MFARVQVVSRQLAADAKYDRENDAKFRAVRQKVRVQGCGRAAWLLLGRTGHPTNASMLQSWGWGRGQKAKGVPG